MTPSRTLLVTDIHGAYKALLQVLERAKFDPANDMLISLGDVCDCWPEVTKCVEFLSSLEHHKYVMGNHDDWCYKWLGDFLGERACGLHYEDRRTWVKQGGQATLDSMESHNSHQLMYSYLNEANSYHLLDEDLLVHGGLPKHGSLTTTLASDLMWDRSMVIDALTSDTGDVVRPRYNAVFCGHTPTTLLKIHESTIPIHKSNVWMLDTGASYSGKLTVFDHGTHEFWQSDQVKKLYPKHKSR